VSAWLPGGTVGGAAFLLAAGSPGDRSLRGQARATTTRSKEVTSMRVKPYPNVQHVIDGARDAITVKRVYGDAYERNGVTVIPAARVTGGGGGGGGEDDDEGLHRGGSGAGFGLTARPVGAFVITEDKVRWRPAFDVNVFLIWGNIVAIVYFLTKWRVDVARARFQGR
jgi:uncharacterized spore protein YtfJ